MKLPRDEEVPTLEMTPMIDCVFLLLIFFLVAATIRKKHNELPIDLPSSGNSVVKKATDETLIISLVKGRGNDVIYAFTTMAQTMTTTGGKREEVTWQQLLDKVEEAVKQNPNRRVRIDADQGVAWGKVAQVVDSLEVHGLKRIGFRTRDNTGGGG